MRRLRLLWTPFVLLVLVLAAYGWRGHGPQSLAAVEDPAIAPMLKDPAIIAKGSYLATAGDCMSCHTAQGGQPYAGGRMLPTPFGSIPAPNLTPDVATGLGQWHFNDFWRALHTGVGRDGELLYPAFSYTAFTKVTREDAIAMFAYLQSLPPVHEPARSSTLRFPYNVRSTLAAWRAIYFKPGAFEPDPKQSASWNRGAYLVQGLGTATNAMPHVVRGAALMHPCRCLEDRCRYRTGLLSISACKPMAVCKAGASGMSLTC